MAVGSDEVDAQCTALGAVAKIKSVLAAL